MFNNKKIRVTKRSDEYEVDEYGVIKHVDKSLGEYLVDIQPISKEKCKLIFGDFPNVKYQVWSDFRIEGFSTDCKVIYNGVEYEVLNIIEWDDDWYCLNFIVGVDIVG